MTSFGADLAVSAWAAVAVGPPARPVASTVAPAAWRAVRRDRGVFMRDSLQQGGGRGYLRPVVDMPATKPRWAIRKISRIGTTYITEAAAWRLVTGVPAEVT